MVLMSAVLAGVEFVFNTMVVVLKHSSKFFDTSPIKMLAPCPFIYVPLLNVGRSDSIDFSS